MNPIAGFETQKGARLNSGQSVVNTLKEKKVRRAAIAAVGETTVRMRRSEREQSFKAGPSP